MTRLLLKNTPKSKAELLAQCQAVEGMTLAQLASSLHLQIPVTPSQRKGWVGQALELALGANAGNQPLPDFEHLGIELKTLPLNYHGKPAESTFVTSIPLLTVHQETWHTSSCYAKLKCVLWLPIEGDGRIPVQQRRIGRARLWSPNPQQEAILAKDWEELTFMIGSGLLAEVDARLGQYLQVRPKGASSRSLCYGFDQDGQKIVTMPRGFYLRSRFTAAILAEN